MFKEADTPNDEEIISIAQRLTDEGRPVSPVTVWSELRRGSIVSVAAALQRWRDAHQPAAPAAPFPAEVPPEFAEALMNAAHGLRKASWDEAQSATARHADLLSQRLDTALTERDEALAVYQQAQAEASNGRRQLEQSMYGLRASEETAARLQTQLAATNERADAAEARAGELAQRALAHDAQLNAATLSLDDERRAREALNAELASAREDIARIVGERDEARQESAAKAQEASAAAARAEAASAQAGESAAHIAALQAELEAARGALATEREANASRDEQLQRVTRDFDETRAQADESRARIATLESELAAEREASAQASAVREDLQRVSRELDESRARIATLESELAAEREASAQAFAAHEALQHANRELDEARARIAAFAEEKNTAQGELARVSQEAAAAQSRADEAQQHAASLQQQLAEREQSESAMRDELRDHKIALQTAGTAKDEEIAALQRRISAQAQTHAKSYDELRGNAEQWVTYARDLKQRLDVANEKILFIDARSTGEVALLRRLSTELERLKPDHELVFREAQQKVIGDKIAQQLAQKGYRYDPATAVMSKIEG